LLFLELCYLGILLLGTLLLAIFARYNLCPETIWARYNLCPATICYKIQFVPDTVCARYNLCPIQIVPIQIVPIQFVPIQFVPDTICADTICTWTNLSILTHKIVSKLSEIWFGLFIQDPDPDFFTHPGSQGQKGTGQIRTNQDKFFLSFIINVLPQNRRDVLQFQTIFINLKRDANPDLRLFDLKRRLSDKSGSGSRAMFMIWWIPCCKSSKMFLVWNGKLQNSWKILEHPALESSVVDPDSMNLGPDPAFQMNPVPRLCWPKSEEKNTQKFFTNLFLTKNCNKPPYRTYTLQKPSALKKREHLAL
jgi:hypothetical protein